jgi:hypothetical protein
MPGALAIVLKRPSPALRAYAVVQVISCVYYGLYENRPSESEYRVAYTFLTVIATSLFAWRVVLDYASRGSRTIGLIAGIASLFVMARLLPLADLDTRIVLVQAAGAGAIAVAMACTLPFSPEKMVPATLGALFLGVAVFWYGISLKPEWQDHWDWIAPVWMHTAAYTWLAWKLPWCSKVASVKV